VLLEAALSGKFPCKSLGAVAFAVSTIISPFFWPKQITKSVEQ
jgi:hypothetical protein